MQTLQGNSLQEQEHHTITDRPAKSEGYFTPWIRDVSLRSRKKKQKKAGNRKINEGGKVTQCKDFPRYWETTSSLLGILERERTGGEGGGTIKRGREGKRVWRKRQGRRNVSGDGVLGDGRRQKKGGKKKKRREQKLRQDSRLPGYPHLFIDLAMIECMATEVLAWAAARRWAHCSGDSRLKVAHVHDFRCLKTSVNLELPFLFIRIQERRCLYDKTKH